MKGFLNYDGTLNRWMTKIMYLVSVNLLFLVTSIPIVTIGASETAMCTVLLRYEEGDEPNILKTYFRAFKENFRKSETVWVSFLLIGAFLVLDCSYLGTAEGTVMKALISVIGITALFAVMALVYVFAAIAYFDNNLRGYLSFSLGLALAGLPETVILVILNAVPLFLIVACLSAGSVMIPVFLCCGVSLPAFLKTKIILKQFKKTLGRQEEYQEQV